MGTVMIIVLGVVVISVVGVVGDIVSKIAQAKIKAKGSAGNLPPGELSRLQDRISLLEARIEERDDTVRKLQDEVSFVSRMLEDKSRGGSGS
jgi:hypothetical protein